MKLPARCLLVVAAAMSHSAIGSPRPSASAMLVSFAAGVARIEQRLKELHPDVPGETYLTVNSEVKTNSSTASLLLGNSIPKIGVFANVFEFKYEEGRWILIKATAGGMSDTGEERPLTDIPESSEMLRLVRACFSESTK